ncbi:MAG: hypothetical protein ACREXS_04875 [Gammaproteobacteria bacterium]
MNGSCSTNAFTAGWVPQTVFMVGIVTFGPERSGTLYRACARHWDEAAMKAARSQWA